MLTALSCVAYRDAMFAWPKEIVLRFDSLVRESTRSDPQWTADFLQWLRTSQRYPALVGAAAFASERLAHGEHGMSRQVVNSVLRHPADPGHLLAHWTSTYGSQVPKPVKRGVADAAVRLYSPSALRYDTDGHHLDLPNFINKLTRWRGGIPTPRPFRFGDVIALTHPVARTAEQGELFRLAIDRRYGRAPAVAVEPPDSVEDLVAGLKRFDRSGIPFESAMAVASRLRTEDSGLLPLRFVSARRGLRTTRWLPALEIAAGRHVSTLPEIPGRTLIVVDQDTDDAIVFALTLAQRCASVDVVADNHRRFPVVPGESPLTGLTRWRLGDMVGDAPCGHGATVHMFDRHDRVVVVEREISDVEDIDVPVPVPVYGWQVAHHTCHYCPDGQHDPGPNRAHFFGVSDAAYGAIPVIEGVRAGRWPWSLASH